MVIARPDAKKKQKVTEKNLEKIISDDLISCVNHVLMVWNWKILENHPCPKRPRSGSPLHPPSLGVLLAVYAFHGSEHLLA